MNVLVIGSGGREHALCWAISASPLVDKLYCAPGNAGIGEVATLVPDLAISDHGSVVRFCRDQSIGFVVVGPEAPLVAGLVDDLAQAGIKAFGPSAAAARLEGSKSFTKELCARHRIPTAAFARFTDPAAAKAHIGNKAPIVLKADGLAAGKGVVIATTAAEAHAAVDDILGGQFGAAGRELVIEEFLEGEEASFFALVDGTHVLPMETAQDHKRVGDGDTGPNTGGMGAYSPAPVMTPDMVDRTLREIIAPTVAAMAAEGAPYKGVLYAGLMITAEGPKLIEYNCRFGDPECQVLMMRLKSDILPALIASVDGELADFDLRWRDDAALTVVMAAEGYPGDYARGGEIRNLHKAAAVEGVEIFHAGTRRDGDKILANGGRVLNVTAVAPTIAEARTRAYEAVDRIDWPQGFCRRDIGWRALDRDAS
ncbi:phosphoribosylamine--glycine ligase [Rhodoligotrophos defluvii]|uniref:phosphoribosylamine--glycine ligase n=1 Tax=Rhodoligotrophos defluvii TaxID=2561934 RepID=UPI0010C98100|nr:phosphoribosylamine--glycine ligase [Rhodoligotrophos defluvii]